jgi:uncharacterized RDD family membrane protein YckC
MTPSELSPQGAAHERSDTAPWRSLPRAPMWARIFAFFLDSVLIGALFYLFATTILFPRFHPDFPGAWNRFAQEQSEVRDQSFRKSMEAQYAFQLQHERVFADTQFLMVVLMWLYFALSELILGGSTLGKKVFKLQAVDVKTLKNPLGRTILIRNFVKVVSLTVLSPLLLVNFIIPFFNRSRLTGHDMLAGTMVTYEGSNEEPISQTFENRSEL